MKKVLTVLGARPQFIKAAPVNRALADEGLKNIVVHTGQHFDDNMSAIFFDELGLCSPEYRLGIHGGGHGEMTGRMLIALEAVLLSEKPDIVLIYGDTNSTLAGALAGAKLNIPVAHIEAGLRAFRPMPEETNRIVADRLSTWLFCPTEAAIKNLSREGIRAGVSMVGDVMYDSCLMMRDLARQKSDVLARLDLVEGEYQLATVHRAENTDDKDALARVIAYLNQAAERTPVLLVLHPRTRDAAFRFGLSFDQIRLAEPVGYLDMLRLVEGSHGVLTDSGGLQKEAYFLRRPCVTLRDATEWTETVNCGWNRLWSTAQTLPLREVSGFGDGHAARYIAKLLA